MAADDVIIPLTIDQWSLDGLTILMEQIEAIRKEFNPKLHFAGCLVTQFHKDDVNVQGEAYLRRHGEYKVFHRHIRRSDSKVQESTFARIPVAEYSTRSGAAVDYRHFVEEYLNRLEAVRRHRKAKEA